MLTVSTSVRRSRARAPAPHGGTIWSMADPLIIAGREFRSRLIVGTGKYKSFQETARALEASGADMVTVAVRRVNLARSQGSLLDFLDPKKHFLVPNTPGWYAAD